MGKKIVNIISSILVFALLSCDRIVVASSEETTSGLNATTVKIPDSNFEQALIDLEIDADKTVNGQISKTDAEKATSINISFKKIKNLSGIESFINLNQLMVGYNELTTINLSNNTKLTKLVVHYNKLSGSLDLKTLSSLKKLDTIGNSGISTICVADVSSANSNTNFIKDSNSLFVSCN